MNKTWLIIGLAILVVVIIMIVRSSGEPTDVPVTTTTIEEVVIDDTLPIDGDVIINGEDVVDPIEGEPTE